MQTYRIRWRVQGHTDIEAATEKDAMKSFDQMAVADYAERDYTNLERDKAVAVELKRRGEKLTTD